MSVYEPIEKYITTVLAEQLEPLGIEADFAERIFDTVRAQMQSLIYHWHDEEFRKALLLIGSDEGVYYKPYAHDDIRNFVVVTIRNSELECLHSDDFSRYGLKERLSEDGIKSITSAAIKYFSALDFNKMSDECEAPENDVYGELAEKYPVATQILMELAGSKKVKQDFEKILVYHQPTLEELPISDDRHSAQNTDFGTTLKAFSDGYSFSIESDAKAHLEYCVESGSPFLIDSFKSLTRNVNKLMLIMEFLFSRWTPLVTTNYFISNGHIERRQKPLKAGHSHDDMFRNWQNTKGLAKYHKLFLDKAVEQNRPKK